MSKDSLVLLYNRGQPLVLTCQARKKGLLLYRQWVTHKRQETWSPFPWPAGSESVG